MSIYRYKGSKVWTMDFMFHGQRIRESTEPLQDACREDEDKRRRNWKRARLASGSNSSPVCSRLRQRNGWT